MLHRSMSPTSDERGSISAEHVLVCALVALVGVPAWLALEGAVSTETACVADRVATGDSEPCAGSSSEDEEDVGSPVWNVADTSGADALALSASSPAREPASATAAEPEATTVPWPTPAIAPEPTAAAEPAPAPEPAPGPAPEPAPAPQPTPTIAPEPTPAPAPEPTPSIAPEPEAAPAAELAPALQPPPAPACAPFDLLCEAGHVVSNVVDGAAGAARDTGSFVWGFGSGVVDGGAALVSGTIDLGATVVNGTVDAVTHPVETVNAIATTTVNAVDAVLHPVETGQSILDGAGQLASSVVDAVGDMGNTLVNGTWEERGRLLGRGTFEVASFAVPVTKLGALGGLALHRAPPPRRSRRC